MTFRCGKEGDEPSLGVGEFEGFVSVEGRTPVRSGRGTQSLWHTVQVEGVLTVDTVERQDEYGSSRRSGVCLTYLPTYLLT